MEIVIEGIKRVVVIGTEGSGWASRCRFTSTMDSIIIWMICVHMVSDTHTVLELFGTGSNGTRYSV